MRKLISNLVSKVDDLLINFLISMERSMDMMAMLFACRVVEGRTEFSKVPAKLRAQVAEIIINDFALPELVSVEYGGTAA